MTDTPSPPDADEFDRQRRRVLWALPTGLYLIGSRAGERANLMTANLVVQVCLEPKLVSAAIEAGSVTDQLVTRTGAFALTLLKRESRNVVRRFVKPVTDIERDEAGHLVAMAGEQVDEVGPEALPVLADAAACLALRVTSRMELGSHVLFIGEVTDISGEPADVLRMEDTRMHYGG
jgi:flavin reductase (DIM6/NTAB) family NADH-FMN oxidoreductase RutF